MGQLKLTKENKVLENKPRAQDSCRIKSKVKTKAKNKKPLKIKIKAQYQKYYFPYSFLSEKKESL